MPDTDRDGGEFQQVHTGAVAEGVLGHHRDSSPRSVLRIGDKVVLSVYANMTPARELHLHASASLVFAVYARQGLTTRVIR